MIFVKKFKNFIYFLVQNKIFILKVKFIKRTIEKKAFRKPIQNKFHINFKFYHRF